MNLELINKRVFISASTNGIGLAIARAFLREEAIVVINGRNEEKLKRIYDDLVSEYDKNQVFYYIGDMSVPETILNASRFVVDQLGGIDILIGNLGSGKPQGRNKWNREEWKRLLNINLLSGVSLIDAFLPFFSGAGGSILLMSSLAGHNRLEAPPAYAASKAAINALISHAAKELAKRNIRVNGIAPGNVYFEGGRWEELKEINAGDVQAYIDQEVPVKRFGIPEEIADMVVFLCSEKSSFTTGTVVSIDGGQDRSI